MSDATTDYGLLRNSAGLMGGLSGKSGGLGDNPLMLFLLLDGLGNK